MVKNSLPSMDFNSQTPPAANPVSAAVHFHADEWHSFSLAHVMRVDLKLPPKHRQILSTKIRQLQDAGARLEDGTEVTDKTKALLWILENEVSV